MSSQVHATLVQQLADAVISIASLPVKPAVAAKAVQHLLDGIASAFTGCRSTIFPDLVAARGFVGKDPFLYGEDAAMLWAFAVNASVAEDGSREGACHPAAAVVPVLLVYGEGCSREMLLKAMIAGYEVMIKVARAGNPLFSRKGFHGTAVAAPFGAAAALALLKGFDAKMTANALSLAALGGSGLMAAFRAGSTQPLQVGWGVRNGVAAALIAEKGHAGYQRVMEDGFFPAYLEAVAVEKVMAPLASESALEGCYLKPYPGCRHLHASLDAFSGIMEKEPVNHTDIKRIDVGTYRVALDTGIKQVASRGDAYFNIPYALASRAVFGRVDYATFAESNFSNPDITRLSAIVHEEIDPDIEALYPGQRGASVAVELFDGRILHNRVSFPSGEPEAPLPLAATAMKFRSSLAEYFDTTEIEEVLSTLVSVDSPLVPGFFSRVTRRLFFGHINCM